MIRYEPAPRLSCAPSRPPAPSGVFLRGLTAAALGGAGAALLIQGQAEFPPAPQRPAAVVGAPHGQLRIVLAEAPPPGTQGR